MSGCVDTVDKRIARALPTRVAWAGDTPQRLDHDPALPSFAWYRAQWRAALDTVEHEATAEALRRRARLSLIAHHHDEGISDLERAAELEPENRELIIDLAAALLHRSLVADRPIDAVAALDLLEPIDNRREAACNRAIAADSLYLAKEAARAWASCGRTPRQRQRRDAEPEPDLDLARALFARDGGATLEADLAARPDTWRRLFEKGVACSIWLEPRPPAAPRQEDAALVARIAAYLRESSGDRFAEDAWLELRRPNSDLLAEIETVCDASAGRSEMHGSALGRALARASRRLWPSSPALAALAELESLAADWPNARSSDVTRRFASLSRRFRERGYLGLADRASWYAGLAALEGGYPGRALMSFERARDGYATRGEAASLAAIESLLANTAATIGDFESAWRFKRESLGRIETAGLTERLRSQYWGAAWLAQSREWNQAALVFAREWRARDRPSESAVEKSEEAAFFGYTTLRAGRLDEALRWLDSGKSSCREIRERDDRERFCGTIDLFRGELELAREPATAITLLEASAARMREQNFAYLATQAQVLLARANLAVGDVDGAVRHFSEALAVFADRGGDLARSVQAVRLFEMAAEARDALVLTLFRHREDPWSALAWMDETSSWMEGARRAGSLGFPISVGTPPADAAVVVLHPLSHAVLAWIITEKGRRALEIPLNERALSAWIDLAYRHDGAEDEGSERARAELAQRILGDFAAELGEAESVRFVVSGRLSELAWAGFPSPGGALLGERLRIDISHTAAAALAGTEAAGAAAEWTNPLVVSDPEIGAGAEATLPRLAGATDEGREVAALLRGATHLVGAEARRDRVLALLEHADLAHFATHVLAEPAQPLAARLVLGPDPREEDGELTAERILELDLRGLRLVVLSACDSGRGFASRAAGQLSLARAFLAAGAGQVLATLRPIDDQLARRFVHRFYHHLLETGDPREALWRTQHEAREGSDPDLARREVWSAFQLYSGLPRERPAGEPATRPSNVSREEAAS